MLKLIYFFRGYLIIKVSGIAPERFMNLCANRNIMLWNIQETADGYIMCITLKSFWTIRDIVRKTSTKVVVLKRTGLPFFIPKMKKRWILFTGILLFLICFCISQMFLWQIRIAGNITLSEEDIKTCLEEQQISIHMKKSDVDTELLEKTLRNKFSVITWVSVHISGNELHIEIKENDKLIINDTKNEIENAYDICASISGKVDYIVTRNGTPCVKKGMSVEKGDTLVHGVVEILNDDRTIKNLQYVAADADIILSGIIEKTFSTPLMEEVKTYTGKTTDYPYIQWNSPYHLIGLFHQNYLNYDVELLTEKQLINHKNLVIKTGMLRMRELELSTREKTKETYQRQLQEELEEYLVSLCEKGIQITGKNVKIKKSMDIVELKVILNVKGSFVTRKNLEYSNDSMANHATNTEMP